MARLYFVHWDKAEALAQVRALRAAGHAVAYHWDRERGADTWRRFRAAPPEVLVISLARLPSHGRRVAAVTGQSRRYRDIPVVFVDGEPEKRAVARREFPRAVFTTSERLVETLARLG